MQMIRLNLKWICIALVLIAPYVEMVRVTVDNYQHFPRFKLPNEIFDQTNQSKIGLTEACATIFTLKYFFVLYAIGWGVGLKSSVLYDDFKNGMNGYSVIYSTSLLFLVFFLFTLLLFGMGYYLQQKPFIVISSLLIIVSLMLTKNKLCNTSEKRKNIEIN
jgi:hypothetical protein